MNDRKATARSGKARDGMRKYGLVIRSSAVNVDETDLAAECDVLKPETACQKIADREYERSKRKSDIGKVLLQSHSAVLELPKTPRRLRSARSPF